MVASRSDSSRVEFDQIGQIVPDGPCSYAFLLPFHRRHRTSSMQGTYASSTVVVFDSAKAIVGLPGFARGNRFGKTTRLSLDSSRDKLHDFS